MMNKRPNHQFYSPNKGPSRFISVDEEQSAFGSSCLSHHQPPIKDPTTSNCLTLMSDLVEEINNNFVLNDPHTVEVLSDSIGKLFFTLPPLLLPAGHCW
jgi:hypothetical protein